MDEGNTATKGLPTTEIVKKNDTLMQVHNNIRL